MVVGRGSQDSGWGWLATAGAVTPCQCLGIDCGKWCSLASSGQPSPGQTAESSSGGETVRGAGGQRAAPAEAAVAAISGPGGPGGCPLAQALQSLPPSEPGQQRGQD